MKDKYTAAEDKFDDYLAKRNPTKKVKKKKKEKKEEDEGKKDGDDDK